MIFANITLHPSARCERSQQKSGQRRLLVLRSKKKHPSQGTSAVVFCLITTKRSRTLPWARTKKPPMATSSGLRRFRGSLRGDVKHHGRRCRLKSLSCIVSIKVF